MSEYQYYEFQAIDRALTAKEQAEIAKLSSRVQLTPHRAIFLYNYGDFRGNPEQVLTQYFDMMFYIANWGTWQLIFRFPKAMVDPAWFQPYELPDTLSMSTSGKYTVLNIQINQEEGIYGWVEGEGWLPRLLPLREDLMQGDVRLLYLVWLRVAPLLTGYDLEEDPIEPPIPPNLSQLSDPLKAFIELVELDPDLVNAAAQSSPRQTPASQPPLENWLPELSRDEQQEFLLKLVRREPHVDLKLIQRLQELAGTAQSTVQTAPGQRRLSELQAIADRTTTQRQQAEAAAAKQQRIKELQALSPKEAQTWDRVMNLIALKQSRAYDEATALLHDLRDLAEYQGRLAEFARRFERLKADYSNRSALLRRLASIRVT
jgi:hypothetical protein